VEARPQVLERVQTSLVKICVGVVPHGHGVGFVGIEPAIEILVGVDGHLSQAGLAVILMPVTVEVLPLPSVDRTRLKRGERIWGPENVVPIKRIGHTVACQEASIFKSLTVKLLLTRTPLDAGKDRHGSLL
jgi:hypothetical protein